MTTCPNCKNEVDYVCSHKECSCWKNSPDEKTHLIYGWEMFYWRIPLWLGNFLWKATWFFHPGSRISNIYHWLAEKRGWKDKYIPMKYHWITWIGLQPASFLIEIEICPLCGFIDTFDSWEIRSMEEAVP